MSKKSNTVIKDRAEIKGMAKHLRTDQDGNIVISRSALLLVGTILSIVAFLAGLIGQVLAANADYVKLEQDVAACKEKTDEIDQNTKDIAVIQESIKSIQKSQERIEDKLDQVIMG